jgi:Ca2+-binding EF-hand superfamily protein
MMRKGLALGKRVAVVPKNNGLVQVRASAYSAIATQGFRS